MGVVPIKMISVLSMFFFFFFKLSFGEFAKPYERVCNVMVL